LEDRPKETIKVLDRRKFTSDGERRQGPDAPPIEPPAPEPAAAAEPPAAPVTPAGPPAGPVPKVNQAFAYLVEYLAQNCAMSLGMGDPHSGVRGPVDLQTANLFIEFLEALQEKTGGNLAPPEKKLLEEALFQLKMIYAQAGTKRPQ
jgi:hypothetical protein